MSRLSKFTLIWVAVVLWPAGLAAESLLASFMPDNDQLSGWKIIEGTDRRGMTK